MIKLSPLELLYQDAKNVLEDEKESQKRNITQIFLNDLKNKIQHGELITIVIRGLVRKGKSTGGIAIQHYINQLLQKQNTLKLIFSDQIEWTNFVTKTEIKNACVLCDEYSRMGEGGYNSTTESQLFTTYLEMFAANYIHTIFITPGHNYNEHATIILDVLEKDEKNQITHFKLLYRNKLEGTTVCLGRIEIDVSKIIQQGYYDAYLKKKRARLDLLNKHGIRDIRELIFAKLTLKTYNKLLPLAYTTKLPTEMISIAFSEIARKDKIILSILSETGITNKVRGLLGTQIQINKAEQKAEQHAKKGETKKQIQKLNEANMMQELLNDTIKSFKNQEKVYEQYQMIGGE